MALRVAKAHANKIRANGHHTPSSNHSTPNAPGRGPGRTRSHFHYTYLSPFLVAVTLVYGTAILVFGLLCCHTASNPITTEMHTRGVQ